MRYIPFKPYEFVSVGAVSIVIIYVLFGQLLIVSGVVLPVCTILSLAASLTYFGRLITSKSYFMFLFITSAFSLIVTDNIAATKPTIILLLKVFLFFLAVINAMNFESGFKCIRLATIFSGVMVACKLLENATVGGRISASNQINANVVAATLLVSVFMAAYELEIQKNSKRKFFYLLCIVLMSFASILTGTRKVFLSIVVFLVAYLLLVEFFDREKKGSLKKLFVIILGMAFLYYFISYAMDSIIGERLANTGYEGDKMRNFFYLTAFNMFKEKPILGFGWGGFAARVGMYSHSTYAELLANTGFVGVILFFIFVMTIIIKLIKKIKTNSSMNSKFYNTYRIALLSFLIVLALGFGTAFFYEINLTLAIAVAQYMADSRNGIYCTREVDL